MRRWGVNFKSFSLKQFLITRLNYILVSNLEYINQMLSALALSDAPPTPATCVLCRPNRKTTTVWTIRAQVDSQLTQTKRSMGQKVIQTQWLNMARVKQVMCQYLPINRFYRLLLWICLPRSSFVSNDLLFFVFVSFT